MSYLALIQDVLAEYEKHNRHADAIDVCRAIRDIIGGHDQGCRDCDDCREMQP